MQNAILYLRVSTDTQDTDNQLAECELWARAHNLHTRDIIRDTSSTACPWAQRGVSTALSSAVAGDTLIVAEVSRLARSTLEVLEILREAATRGVSVHVVKSGLILDGSMQARIVVTVLALAAEIERDFIRARTRAALAARRAKGLPLGRPIGSGGRTKVDAHSDELSKLRAAGVSAAAAARLLGVSRGTIRRWSALHPTSKG